MLMEDVDGFDGWIIQKGTGVSMRTKTDNYIHVRALPVSGLLLEGFGSRTTALSETTWEYTEPY